MLELPEVGFTHKCIYVERKTATGINKANLPDGYKVRKELSLYICVVRDRRALVTDPHKLFICN